MKDLAGSTSTLFDCVKTAISFGISEVDAVKMASENPARLMGLNKGKIEVGYDADFIIPRFRAPWHWPCTEIWMFPVLAKCPPADSVWILLWWMSLIAPGWMLLFARMSLRVGRCMWSVLP